MYTKEERREKDIHKYIPKSINHIKKDGEDCNEATNNIIHKSTTINHIIKMPD